MLWTVWPSGARITFNCYQHHVVLVIQNKVGDAIFLPSREGVTQGNPLAMVGYRVGVLPLIRQLKEEFPNVK
jgi:hypothetical protein